MKLRVENIFLALILAQAAHSVEEYVFRLYDVLAPARYVSSLFGVDRQIGFVVVNTMLVLFGLWGWNRTRRSGRAALAWFWALLEIANGIAHLALAAMAGGYFPGLATAPLLMALGGWLAFGLARRLPGVA